jgi:hypothetical protein
MVGQGFINLTLTHQFFLWKQEAKCWVDTKSFTLINSWANYMVNSSRYIFWSHHVLFYTINVYWRFIARRELFFFEVGRKNEYVINYVVFIVVVPVFCFPFFFAKFNKKLEKLVKFTLEEQKFPEMFQGICWKIVKFCQKKNHWVVVPW